MAKKTGTKNLLKVTKIKKKKPNSKKMKVIKDEKPPKKKKKIKQSFKEDSTVFETNKVIFRIRQDPKDKDILKKYPSDIRFNKNNKIGSKTKVATGNWTEIIDIITDEKDLVFVLMPGLTD